MKVIHFALVLSFAILTGACEKQPYAETRAFTRHGGEAHAAPAAGHTNGAPAPHATPTPATEKSSAH